MSARSTTVKVENYSSVKLQLDQASLQLEHGEWVTYPPKTIPAAQGGEPGRGEWENDSDGFMTGDEGRCAYHFVDRDLDIQTIRFSWDNPYVGSNGYQITTTSNQVKTSYEGGGGNNATVTYYIKDNA